MLSGHGAGPLSVATDCRISHICGTVVCSIGVFFLPIGTNKVVWSGIELSNNCQKGE